MLIFKRIGRVIPGVAVSLLIALVAKTIESFLPIHIVGASVIALFTSKKVLKFAIILLGASLSVKVILSVGKLSLMVMLHLPTIEQLVLYKNNSEIISVNDLNNVDFQDTILLQYDESKTNDGYKAKIYLLFNSNKEFDSALIEISYNKSVAMWDELKDVSWFE